MNQPLTDILKNVSITKVVSNYLSVTRKLAICPFHQDNKPSLSLSENKGLFYCFGCQRGGNAVQFVKDYLDVSFPQAIKIVADICDVKLQAHYKVDKRSHRLVHANKEFKMCCIDNMGFAAKNYLNKRGLNDDIIAKFQLGYCDTAQNLTSSKSDLAILGLLHIGKSKNYFDAFSERIIFPIHDTKGTCRGFGGRALKDSIVPKYINSTNNPLFDKKSTIYGLYEALLSRNKDKRVFVVEGYMDVITMSRYNMINTVSCLGVRINSFQLQALFQYYDHIVFCFDGDPAGQNAMLQIIPQISPLISTRKKASFCLFPPGYDPDLYLEKFGSKKTTALLQNTLSIEKFTLNSISNLTSSDKLHTLGNLFKSMCLCPQKIALIKYCSKKLQVSYDDMLDLCKAHDKADKASEIFDRSSIDRSSSIEERAAAIMMQHPKESYDNYATQNWPSKYTLLNSISECIQKHKGKLNTSALCQELEHQGHQQLFYLAHKKLELSNKALIEELKAICNLFNR